MTAPYPHSPGWKAGAPETSRKAAQAFAPKAIPLRVRVLEVLERGPATAEQVANQIDAHWMVIRARCSELRAQGLIDDSGQRGAGALGGKVVIWRATTPLERAAHSARVAS